MPPRASGRRQSGRRLPGGGVSLSGNAPGMAGGPAIVARFGPGNLAADGEERPLYVPERKTPPPSRRLQLSD